MLRQTSGATGFTFVGAPGTRSFTDDSLPAGAAPVTYRVTAIRSTLRGDPAQFTVSFGSSDSGLSIASVVESAEDRCLKTKALHR